MAKSIFTRADSLPERWVLPTPSLGLNRALNGGLMSGMVHTFWGPKASGKTTIALHAVAEAQRMGYQCTYVDAEKTFTPSWAARCGVNLGELDICFKQRVETILDELLPKIRKQETQVIVIDSLSSLFFNDFLEKAEAGAIGGGARAQNFFMSKVLDAMDPFNTHIICIAHQTNKTNGQTFSLQAKMSESMEMWTASKVKFRKDMSKEEYRDVKDRMTIHWEIQKSKWSNYPAEGQYRLWASPNNNVHIDNIDELSREAIESGLFIKSGAWFKYDGQTFHGEPAITKSFNENEELLNQVKKELGL